MAPRRKKHQVTKTIGDVEKSAGPDSKKRKVSKSTVHSEEGVARKKKTFFDLPAEIRNSIYELVLIDGEVVVNKDLKQPHLLQTCRQIRSETLRFWYMQSDFVIHVVDCDARLLGKWARHAAVHYDWKTESRNMGMVLKGQPD